MRWVRLIVEKQALLIGWDLLVLMWAPKCLKDGNQYNTIYNLFSIFLKEYWEEMNNSVPHYARRRMQIDLDKTALMMEQEAVVMYLDLSTVSSVAKFYCVASTTSYLKVDLT